MMMTKDMSAGDGRRRLANVQARTDQLRELVTTIREHVLAEVETYLSTAHEAPVVAVEGARQFLARADVLLGLVVDLQDASHADLDRIEQLLPSSLPLAEIAPSAGL